MHERARAAEQNAQAVADAFRAAGYDLKDLTAREAAELADKLGLTTTWRTPYTADTIRTVQKRFGGPKPAGVCGAAAHKARHTPEAVAAKERREAAKREGAMFYDGLPCARAGHTRRYVIGNACAECSRTSRREPTAPAVAEPPRRDFDAERRERREVERLAQLDAERQNPVAPSGFNAADAEAIKQAIAAGRVQRVPSGQWRSTARLCRPADFLLDD